MSEAKTALVTGGAGFIGSHLVDRLLSLGYKTIVVDNLSTGKRQNLNPGATFHHGDITQALVDEVFQRERPNLAFHLAAQVSVAQSTRDPVGDAEINLLGTLHLLEVARHYGIEKFIYSSTGGALYGEPETNPSTGSGQAPRTEEHPIVPLSPYGVSKHQAEQYLELYHRLYRLNYTTLRYGNVYGPRQDPHGEAGVVAIFTQAMLEGMDTQIFGDGWQERDFTYVDDVVEANVCAITRGDAQAINIGTGEGSSVNRIFQLLRDIIGYQRAPVYRPPRLGEVYRISLDWGKAARELGWAPRVGLEEGLRRTVEYFRKAAADNPRGTETLRRMER